MGCLWNCQEQHIKGGQWDAMLLDLDKFRIFQGDASGFVGKSFVGVNGMMMEQ